MLLDPAAATEAIARYDADPAAGAAWAARQLGTARSMPYVVGRDALAPGGRLIFNAVGGVEWNALSSAQRDEVKAALRQADWLSVRDHVTQAALRAEGIDAPLCPDPAVMVAACFGEVIRRHQQQGAVKAMRDAFPQGYLACQFSADFADDASLDALARGLSRVAAATGLGLALFRAGAAPWHDDPALYESLLRRLPSGTAQLFPSLHLWDICALIAASRGVVGSSLHGRIVALAYGLPRVSLMPPQQGGRPDKRTAFAETWEPDAVPRGVALDRIEAAVLQALAVPAERAARECGQPARALPAKPGAVDRPAVAMNQAGRPVLRNNPKTTKRLKPTMPIAILSPADLRLTIDPASLGFADTSELMQEPLPWIGQARAEAAARFGLGMDQPNYNLFVLGEVGSGRSSLLKQAMHAVAASKRVPPDLCYLHNFDAPERPLALRLPAGEGRLLRQSLAQAVKTLQSEIPQRLDGQDYKAESERIEKAWKDDVARHYAELTTFAEARSFSLHREAGRMVFTLTGKKGQALTEDEVLALPKARRAEVEQAEQELRAEITRYIEKTQPLERAMNEALAALRRQVVKPLRRARAAGDPCRTEEADQGRRQAQRLARRAGTGRVRQSGTVHWRRGRRRPGRRPCRRCWRATASTWWSTTAG